MYQENSQKFIIINDESFMYSLADDFFVIFCRYFKDKSASVNLYQLAAAHDSHAKRRSGVVGLGKPFLKIAKQWDRTSIPLFC